MFSFLELPLAPIISLFFIIPLIFWQANLYFKEKSKNRTPSVPQIKSHKEHTNQDHHSGIKNVTLIENLKMKNKTEKKTSVVFSAAIFVFVIINVLIITFYLNNRKLTYLPRASQSVTPTSITNLNPLNSTTVTQQPSPTKSVTPTTITDSSPSPTYQVLPTRVPTQKITPELNTTIFPTATVVPTMVPTTIPTLIPTSMSTPTVGPTLIAQAYTLPSTMPTSKPTTVVSKKPTPTHPATVTVTPVIPIVGISNVSILLGVMSVFFLILGLIL